MMSLLTLYPEDLKWQPRFVSVDFILMQNALSKPLYAFVLDSDITDETVKKNIYICIKIIIYMICDMVFVKKYSGVE